MDAFKKNKNKIIIIGAVLLIALLGYSMLSSFEKERPANNDIEKKYESFFKSIKSGANVNTNSVDANSPRLDDIKGETYDVSYPTIGPLFITAPATVTPEGLQISLGDNDAFIKEKQRVLFYTSQGHIAAESEISAIQKIAENTIQASYTPINNIADKTKILSADIILHETGTTKRIPQSALSLENGTYFVYLIKTKRNVNNNAIIIPDGKTVVGKITKQAFKKTTEDKWHAAASYKIHKADLVLLKPDPKIKNGDFVKVHIINSSPPVLSRTESWLKNIDKQRFADIKADQQRVEDCGLNATIGATSSVNSETSSRPAGSCANAPDANAPFDAFKLLGIPPPEKP